jgi:DNA-binding NarL/FixJ family response regulator
VKVLIADDSAVVRQRLAELISEIERVEVVSQAGDALEALAAIEETTPDVAILDIRMPGANGIEALAEIKKERPAPVVIMLTNYPYPQYRKKCLDAGADYFFDKSTEFERVVEVIAHLAASVPREVIG